MAWTRVQSKSGTTTGALTFTVTLTGTPVTGNKILVAVSLSTAGIITLSGVADSAANALTQAFGNHNTGNVWSYLFFYDVPATPHTAFTVSASSGTPEMSVVVVEYSGLLAGSTTAALDGTPASTGISGSATPTGTSPYSSTAANELLVALFCDFGNSATVTVPAGYTSDANSVNTNATADCIFATKNSANGAEANSFTYTPTTGNQWAIGMVAFKLAAGAAAVIPNVNMAVQR